MKSWAFLNYCGASGASALAAPQVYAYMHPSSVPSKLPPVHVEVTRVRSAGNVIVITRNLFIFMFFLILFFLSIHVHGTHQWRHGAGQHVGLQCVVPQKHTDGSFITGQTRNVPIFAMYNCTCRPKWHGCVQNEHPFRRYTFRQSCNSASEVIGLVRFGRDKRCSQCVSRFHKKIFPELMKDLLQC